MSVLTFQKDKFFKNGKEHRILSGAMHYFRIPREYWRDRLEKLRQCGFNTVETYVCWNLHEPEEGVFDFTGNLDLAAYIDEAKAVGLDVYLRPGPYICAEWEFGGLPYWLHDYPRMSLRCYDEAYLEKVDIYLNKIFGIARPRMAENGGNIVMMQVENEYGSYGNDKKYLNWLKDRYIEYGATCLLCTSDGPSYWMLKGGAVDDILATVNFGSNPEGAFEVLKQFRADQPLMCSEFWCGWFDHWGESRHERSADDVADNYDRLLKQGGNINFYMFHGGTNFGFMNGANHQEEYAPTVTSYDYFAPLSEAGDMTECYYKLREVNEKHFGTLPPLTVKNSVKKAYGALKLEHCGDIWHNTDTISKVVDSPAPKYIEDIGQDYGYTLYRTKIKGPFYNQPLSLPEMRDRAIVYFDGECIGKIENGYKAENIALNDTSDDIHTLDILTENMGRVNYGPRVGDKKGLNKVMLDLQHLFGWEIYPFDMRHTENLKNEGERLPAFFKGTLDIADTPCDTFLRPSGFTHGFISVNGINIGRFHNDRGPQKTLYVPAPFLKKGKNEIIIFETDSVSDCTIEFTDVHDLG